MSGETPSNWTPDNGPNESIVRGGGQGFPDKAGKPGYSRKNNPDKSEHGCVRPCPAPPIGAGYADNPDSQVAEKSRDERAANAERQRRKRKRERAGLVHYADWLPHRAVEGLLDLAEALGCSPAEVFMRLVERAAKNPPLLVARDETRRSILSD